MKFLVILFLSLFYVLNLHMLVQWLINHVIFLVQLKKQVF